MLLIQLVLINRNDFQLYFDGNTAGDYITPTVSSTNNGGAIVLKDGNDIVINNSLFYDNRSMGFGGAITAGHYAAGGTSPTLTIKNSLFYRNRWHSPVMLMEEYILQMRI